MFQGRITVGEGGGQRGCGWLKCMGWGLETRKGSLGGLQKDYHCERKMKGVCVVKGVCVCGDGGSEGRNDCNT